MHTRLRPKRQPCSGRRTLTEGCCGGLQALLQGFGGVHLYGRARFGATHQGKVDARVQRRHNLAQAHSEFMLLPAIPYMEHVCTVSGGDYVASSLHRTCQNRLVHHSYLASCALFHISKFAAGMTRRKGRAIATLQPLAAGAQSERYLATHCADLGVAPECGVFTLSWHACQRDRTKGTCGRRGSPLPNVLPANCGRPSSTNGDAGLAALPRSTPCSMSFAAEACRALSSICDCQRKQAPLAMRSLCGCMQLATQL